MSCSSRIVYLGYAGFQNLEPAIPLLENLSEFVPSAELSFELIPRDTSVEELNAVVQGYVDAGYNYIGLPDDPPLLRQFLNSGLSTWPNTQFLIMYYEFIDRLYQNVHIFYDMNTLQEDSFIQHNLTYMIESAGMIYVIYEGADDPITLWQKDLAEKALADLGVTARFYEVGSSGQEKFSPENMERAVRDISMSLPPEPSNSAIIHIINWFDAEEYTQLALEKGLFDFPESRVSHSSFLSNYYPIQTSLPVTLYIGKIPVGGIPSAQSTAIGMPLAPSEYYKYTFILPYLDSYMWAATCGETFGINDKQLIFDDQNVRITYYLADFTIPPGELGPVIGPLLFNPRWFDQDAPVVPFRNLR